MSTRYKNGSHYENHPKAAELHDGAAHAHEVGELNGMQEHLTGNEQSRHALEHQATAHEQGHVPMNGHGVATFGHEEIARLALELWHTRGCPEGSQDEDWFHAVEILRSHAQTR